jgi:hypothetical protein
LTKDRSDIALAKLFYVFDNLLLRGCAAKSRDILSPAVP